MQDCGLDPGRERGHQWKRESNLDKVQSVVSSHGATSVSSLGQTRQRDVSDERGENCAAAHRETRGTGSEAFLEMPN